MRRSQRGSTLTEFALAWPIVLLLVLVAIQLAVYGVEVYAARDSALIGARVGSEAGSGTGPAAGATIAAIRPSLVEATAIRWCPDPKTPGGPPNHGVWVCATDQGTNIQVTVGGAVPAVVPLPVSGGLPIGASATIAKETFQP